MNSKQAQELVKLANDLDRIERKDLADRVDNILKEARTAGIVKALRSILAVHLDSKGIEHNLNVESDKWGNDLQSAWENWTTNIGRPDIGTDWQGKAKEYGYTPNVQGMWDFIQDYKGEGYVGQGGLSGEGIDKAVPKHYYDTYMRHAEPQRAAIRADDNWWPTIQEFAQANNKPLPGAEGATPATTPPSRPPQVDVPGVEDFAAGQDLISQVSGAGTAETAEASPGNEAATLRPGQQRRQQRRQNRENERALEEAEEAVNMTREGARYNNIKKTASSISDLFSDGDVSSVRR
ncbi:hypothetical protein CMI47_09300 [Candidatus Pacearchaeota archaeon]|nr:hypothetical protein [Candidatus Pacearchaeota archaeon]